MDNNFGSLDPQRTPRRKKSDPDLVWNILTLVMLVGTLCVAGISYSLFLDPQNIINPFPPSTPTFTPIPPTWTPITFGSTWTPTATIQPSPSNTPRPTITLEASITPFSLASATSALTPTVTGKPTGAPYFTTISYYDGANSPYSTNADCTKLLIAGRAELKPDSKGNRPPLTGAIVKMGGGLPGKTFTPSDYTTLTGIATNFGGGGFVLDTGLEPVESTKTLWVQLFNQTSALSEQVFVTTYKDCKKNLVYITFQEK